MTPDIPDEVPDWIAELDQLTKGMADFAKTLRSYYVSLVDEGFTPSEALMLVVEWQKATIGNMGES